MALLGGLDPSQQQRDQRAAVTAQSQHWEDELTKMLREGGQHQQQAFTSPWQVAGQMAQALSGRMHAGQNAANYAALNSNLAPGEDQGEGPAGPPPTEAGAPSTGAAAAPTGSTTDSAPASNVKHGGTPFSPEIKQAIIEGSQLAGVDPNMMATFAHIESDGKPDAHKRGSQYKGLMQLNEHEMAELSGGQGNVWNPRDSARAAGMIAKRNGEAYEKFTGRQASPFDLYMMHQQGPAGYLQHIGNPDAPAIQNMLGTSEGRAKGPGWAHMAITENGGHAGDTSAQFIGRWRAKFDRMAGGDLNAFQTAQAPGSTTPGAASPTGAPGAAAGAPGLSLVEHGRFVDPSQFQQPQATYDLPRLQALAKSGMLSPEQIDKFNQERIGAQQPRTIEVTGGKVIFDPRTGQQSYIPTIQTKPVKIGDIETQQMFYLDSRGQRHMIGGAQSAGAPAQGGAPATPPAPGAPAGTPSLGHALDTGDIDEMAAAGGARSVDLAGRKAGAEAAAKVGPEIELAAGKTRAEGQEKDWNAAHTGFTGMGLNFAQQAPNLKTLTKLAPLAYTGTGADTMLALNRFADKIGLSKRAAAPRELFEQLATKILGDQFSGIRNASLEEGNPAARIFKAMLDVEEKSNINAQDSLPGVMAKLKRMQNVADRGMHWADLADEYVTKNKHLDPKFMTQLRKEIANTDYDEGVEDFGELPRAAPPAGAIEKLRGNPGLREKFDEKYGKGAAERALGAH